MSTHRTTRVAAGLLLTGTLVFALDSMFGQLYRVGMVDETLRLLASTDPALALLPGSQTPVLRVFTGWQPLDMLLSLSNIMFANVADGTRPELSLYAVQFGGQLVPIFAVLMIEGLRVGNAAGLFFYSVLWGYLMQIFGYGNIMPIYACLHLFTSPAATADTAAIRPRSLAPVGLDAVVPAFGIGYLIPSCLFAYPFASGALRQWLVVLWQGFPHNVVGWQYLFSRMPTGRSYSAPPEARSWSRDYRALSDVYDFAFRVGAAAQILVYAILAAAYLIPSVFPVALADTLTFGDVFVPGHFHSHRKMDSLGSAMHTMFLYDQYAGSVAALIWAVTLYVTSTGKPVTARLTWDVVRWSLLAGPAGALVRVIQLRDRVLLVDDKKKA